MSADLSREFKLVAACCVWPPSPARDARILADATPTLDWARVAAIAYRQRVEGLVHAGLTGAGASLPAATANSLHSAAREVARRSLIQAAESGRLQKLLDEAQIPNLVLKGAAVEVLAYGALGMKSAWDIDLLVSQGRVREACVALDAAGYDLVQPQGLAPAQFATWIALTKECELAHRHSGVRVELHWRFADGPGLLAKLDVASSCQRVGVAEEIKLRTLAREELFSYLCVHGAMHGWSRLKWLADLAALLSEETPEDIENLYRRSRSLGAGLCAAQALLLCDRLLGLTLSSALLRELRSGWAVKWLEHVALVTMTGGDAEREIEDRPFAATRILLSQLALGGTWRFAFAQLRYRSVSLHDRIHIPLPPSLDFLYPLIRAPSWVWRRAWRSATR